MTYIFCYLSVPVCHRGMIFVVVVDTLFGYACTNYFVCRSFVLAVVLVDVRWCGSRFVSVLISRSYFPGNTQSLWVMR